VINGHIVTVVDGVCVGWIQHKSGGVNKQNACDGGDIVGSEETWVVDGKGNVVEIMIKKVTMAPVYRRGTKGRGHTKVAAQMRS
jgi:hypothetical protein